MFSLFFRVNFIYFKKFYGYKLYVINIFYIIKNKIEIL